MNHYQVEFLIDYDAHEVSDETLDILMDHLEEVSGVLGTASSKDPRFHGIFSLQRGSFLLACDSARKILFTALHAAGWTDSPLVQLEIMTEDEWDKREAAR